MITDRQKAEMEKTQIFQWIAIKTLVVENGKILLGKRLDQDDYGRFELPGGKLEVGENFVQSVKREVKEETGVQIEVANLYKEKGCPIAIAQTGRQHNIVLIFVLAHVISKEKIQSENEELSEINFYSKDEVRKLLDQRLVRPAMVEILERFIKGEFNG